MPVERIPTISISTRRIVDAEPLQGVDIVDNGGTTDQIELDVNSTGFDIYLHPQAVLLNKLDLTFNAGVEQLHLTDHADDDTTVTTAPTRADAAADQDRRHDHSGQGGDIDLRARGDFTLRGRRARRRRMETSTSTPMRTRSIRPAPRSLCSARSSRSTSPSTAPGQRHRDRRRGRRAARR